MTNPNIVLSVLAGILFVAVVGGLLYQQGIFKSIKAGHPDLWRSLGEPHLVKKNTPMNNIVFLRFLLKSEYKAIADEELQRKCARFRNFLITYAVAFVLTVGYFLSVSKR
ncbi:MAG: hypothetical protein IPP68_11555 [Elusimicrobia bacterium]|nr:hypothetical protein [Elusimicrobiota bacterium]